MRPPFAHRPTARPRSGLVAAAAAVLAVACGDTPVDAFRPDATRPPYDNSPPRDRLREDFDNQRLIESITGAVLDVNRGALTLEAIDFPELDGESDNNVVGVMQRNGLLEGNDITVAASSAVVASDSIELRAAGSVIIGGEVRVGPGGTTIVAKESIEILETGVLDSRGPVRLMVADPDGTISIAGRLTTRATGESAKNPNIELVGRGSVLILGEITTDAEYLLRGGDIMISVYNEVRIDGPGARVSAHAEPGGTAGMVRVRSDSEVRLTGGAAIGRAPEATPTGKDGPERDGAVEVQGAAIIVDDGSRISSNDSELGSDIDLIARDLIRTGERAAILAGDGQVGGRLNLKAAHVEIGVSSTLSAGAGVTVAGNIHIDAIEDVTIGADASVLAGHGGCARGGDVRINVAGRISVTAPATIAAGDGATEWQELACTRAAPGGNVEIVAHALSGVEEAVRAGLGEPPGTTNVRVDDALRIAAVNLAVRTGGVVLSVPFARTEDAVGLVPRVLDIAAETPDGTSVLVELSGADAADGAYDTWLPVRTGDPEALAPLSNAQWFRYRVTLAGRAYDAPLLDFFDVDLAPKSL